MVFHALATGKLNLADGGVREAGSHEFSGTLKAAAEVGKGAIL